MRIGFRSIGAGGRRAGAILAVLAAVAAVFVVIALAAFDRRDLAA
jgi:hypothetical protein